MIFDKVSVAMARGRKLPQIDKYSNSQSILDTTHRKPILLIAVVAVHIRVIVGEYASPCVG